MTLAALVTLAAPVGRDRHSPKKITDMDDVGILWRPLFQHLGKRCAVLARERSLKTPELTHDHLYLQKCRTGFCHEQVRRD